MLQSAPDYVVPYRGWMLMHGLRAKAQQATDGRLDVLNGGCSFHACLASPVPANMAFGISLLASCAAEPETMQHMFWLPALVRGRTTAMDRHCEEHICRAKESKLMYNLV